MNYQIIQKDLFLSDANILVHQVNCIGIMGSGVARKVRNKYPDVFHAYHEAVKELRGDCLGGCLLVETYDGKRIANLFGQYYYAGYKEDYLYTTDDIIKQPELDSSCQAVRFTNYEAFYRGLVKLRAELKPEETKIAFPYGIGCVRGGANWEVIEAMIKDVFSNTNIDIEVCKI